MSVKIIDEPTIILTAEERDKYAHEYRNAFQFWSGHVPSFETWLRRRLDPDRAPDANRSRQ